MHPGHVRFLKRAKGLGDILVVALVGDSAINMLKGGGKPILPLKDRIEIIGSIRYVDSVVTIDTYDPTPAIKKLTKGGVKVDILVKGDDWEYIPGSEHVIRNGGKLVRLSYSEGFSTSDMIKKIRG